MPFNIIKIELGGGISLVVNKLKRLILPSVAFSTAYFIIFFKYEGIGDCLMQIINGCGHMWFLPMLFWCFIGCWLLVNVNCKEIFKLVFLVMLNIIPLPTMPLRVTSACSFMLYFYSGYMVYQHRDKISDWLNARKIVLMWVGAALCFVVFRPLRDFLVTSNSMESMLKIALISGNHFAQLLYATATLFAFYGTVMLYVKNHNLNKFTIRLAGCCFGIYIFQQFILQLLYYKTSFPKFVGPYWLPWCGFVIATLASYGLTVVFLKTKTGRFLIG